MEPKPALQSSSVILLLQVFLTSSIPIVVKVWPTLLSLVTWQTKMELVWQLSVTLVQTECWLTAMSQLDVTCAIYATSQEVYSNECSTTGQTGRHIRTLRALYQERMSWLTAPQWSRQHRLYAWLVGITRRQGDDILVRGNYTPSAG